MLGLHIPASIPPSRQREPTIDYTDDDNIQLQEQSQDSEAFAKVAINLQDDAAVLDRLRLMFNNFLQKELKDYLKAMIKLIEPNKQKKWPYYLGESEEKKAANFSTKRKLVGEDGLMQPPWWPKLVRYTEPDHLRRNENIDLSVEIMQWLMMDPSARGYSRFIVDGSNPPVSLSPVQFVLARKDNALANSFQQPSKQRGKVDLFRVSLASIWTLAQYYDECCLGNRGMKLRSITLHSCSNKVTDWEAPCYISDVSPTRQIITPVSRKAPKKKSPKKELSVRAKSDNPESKRRRCTLPESVSTSFNEQGQAPEAEEDKTSGQDTDDSRSDSTYVPSIQDSMDSLMIEQRDVKATPKINTRLAHTRIQLSRNQDQPSSSDMSPQVLPSPFQTQYHYVPSTMAYSANIITDFTTGGLTTVGELISIPPQMANPNLRVDYMGFPATIPSNYQFPQYQGIPISLDVSNTLLAHIPADESNAKANASYTPYQN